MYILKQVFLPEGMSTDAIGVDVCNKVRTWGKMGNYRGHNL